MKNNREYILNVLESISSDKTTEVEINSCKGEKKKFHCLTVPSGAFLVKSDDKVSITGNCLHSEASAWLFRTMNSEGYFKLDEVKEEIYAAARLAYEHECQIIKKVFEYGKIDGITDTQMRHFVESRINKVLGNLGLDKVFDVKYNPIAEWFDASVNNIVVNDFFTGQGREYVRTWDENGFEW